MALDTISTNRLKAVADFTPDKDPDGKFITIGRNKAFPKAKDAALAMIAITTQADAELDGVNADPKLTDAGRIDARKKLVARLSPQVKETRQSLKAAMENLRGEMEHIMQQTEGVASPADDREHQLAAERRAILRSMEPAERAKLIRKAATERDPTIIKALHGAPAWDPATANDLERQMVSEAAQALRVESLPELEQVALKNAAEFGQRVERAQVVFERTWERVERGQP